MGHFDEKESQDLAEFAAFMGDTGHLDGPSLVMQIRLPEGCVKALSKLGKMSDAPASQVAANVIEGWLHQAIEEISQYQAARLKS